jgi:hypothetical protein
MAGLISDIISIQTTTDNFDPDVLSIHSGETQQPVHRAIVEGVFFRGPNWHCSQNIEKERHMVSQQHPVVVRDSGGHRDSWMFFTYFQRVFSIRRRNSGIATEYNSIPDS